MEIIGRPKRLPPVRRTKWHRKTVAMCGELRFRATTTGHVPIGGKSDVMRSRETVTTWSKGREAGRCQVNGSHLMSRALHHLLNAEFPPMTAQIGFCFVIGGKTYFRSSRFFCAQTENTFPVGGKRKEVGRARSAKARNEAEGRGAGRRRRRRVWE